MIQSQSTSALANELRNLVKLSASNNLASTTPTTTGLLGYSKSQSKIQTKRPKSAGATSAGASASGTNKIIKSTQITYQGNNNHNNNSHNNVINTSTTSSDLTPKYVKKGGFKMRVNKTMPQEKLIETISSNYLRDMSIPSTLSQGKDSVYLPTPDIKKIKPVDLIPPNESSAELLNLSSYYQENN